MTGLYVPVLMSVIYERAKQSGAAYRFHFAAEAGWDAGASLGCLAGAWAAWATAVPSLAIIPAALGVWAVYWCMRLQAAPAQTSCPQSSPSWPFTSFLPQRDMDGRVSAFARPEHDGEGEIKC